jgi:hypothetical protein
LFYRVPIPAVIMEGVNGSVASNRGLLPLTIRDSGTMGGASVSGARSSGAHSMGGQSVGGASNAALLINSMGGAPNAPPPLAVYPVPPPIAPIPAPLPSTTPLPMVQPDVASVISVLGDSSSDPSAPPAATTALLPAPGITIKDKAVDLGIKDITDKETWIDTNKIIDSQLPRPPYCCGPDSKTLVTTNNNQIASAWWEDRLNFYVKPPISDLFMEESRFDGKGFEMINHIDKYFNPSGTVDSLSYIFNLIDIKPESVITLKARFS